MTGAEVALDCLRDGVVFECGTAPEDLARPHQPYPLVKSAVAPFPLFQYLPAIALLAIGASRGQVLVALGLLSAFAFFGALALLWLTAERAGRAWAPALVLIVAAGPLLWYASSTFGEMLAAALILLFVATVVARRHWALVAGSIWLAGITKETALPFLLALGLVALLALDGRSVRPQVAGLAVGAGAALVTNAAFNLFRFGSLVNEEYFAGANFTVLYGIRSVPVPQRAEFFAGLLVAPNGGLLLFWPLAVALLVAAAVLLFRRGAGVREVWPAAALATTLLVLLGGFASFYQPYGWFAWGPRLVMPWIPALLLLAVLRYGDDLRPTLRACVASRWALLAATASVSVLALPHLAVAREPSLAYDLFQADAACPWDRPAALQGQRWFDCIDHIAWEKPPVLVTVLDGYVSSSRGTLLFLTAFVPACLGLLVLVRERLSAEAGPRTAPRPP